MEVAVLVIGDVGRSPRMQYHAISLSKLESVTNVRLIGMAGETCVREVEINAKLEKHLIRPPLPTRLLPNVFIIEKGAKILRQVLMLIGVLFLEIPKPEYILMQNPPSIPTFFLAQLLSLLRGTKIIIDWHNLAYSVLALNLKSSSHWAVKVSRFYERVFSRCASKHICVTKAMKSYLIEDFGLPGDQIHVMYDRPPAFFYRRSIAEQHRIFVKLTEIIYGQNSDKWSLNETAFTKLIYEEKKVTDVVYKEDKPFLIISSTSWTEDEDFGILLEALTYLDRKMKREDSFNKFPDIICVVTGKGPMKEFYESKMKNLVFKKIKIRTTWLETSDYPALLGSADLGVCLHTSTSGLDLPMKVVDMFGSGLPVCAINYNCLHELVVHEKNGLIFKNATELGEQLNRLAQRNNALLSKLQAGVKETFSENWQEEWDKRVAPIFVPPVEVDQRGLLRYTRSIIMLIVAIIVYYLKVLQ